MEIHVSTDGDVDGSETLHHEIEREVDGALGRFGERLTRIDVHLGDENAAKGGSADKRCTLEARPAGQQPVAVTHHAPGLEEACRGAITKLQALLDSKFGRADDRKGRDTIRRSGAS